MGATVSVVTEGIIQKIDNFIVLPQVSDSPLKSTVMRSGR
jgi:hypothetical protein